MCALWSWPKLLYNYLPFRQPRPLIHSSTQALRKTNVSFDSAPVDLESRAGRQPCFRSPNRRMAQEPVSLYSVGRVRTQPRRSAGNVPGARALFDTCVFRRSFCGRSKRLIHSQKCSDLPAVVNIFGLAEQRHACPVAERTMCEKAKAFSPARGGNS